MEKKNIFRKSNILIIST